MTNDTYWTDETVHVWLSIIYRSSESRGKLRLAPFIISYLVAREYIKRVRKKCHLTDKGVAELIRLTLVLPPGNLTPA